MVATPVFEQTPQNWVVQILPADTTTLKTLVTGASTGTRVYSINVTSTDTSARDVLVYITSGSPAIDYLLGTLSIPITAGFTNAIPSVSILTSSQISSLPYDSNGNRFILIENGAVLKVAAGTTVTAAKSLNFFAQGADF